MFMEMDSEIPTIDLKEVNQRRAIKEKQMWKGTTKEHLQNLENLSISAMNKFRLPILYQAVCKDEVDVVVKLIQRGTNPNECNSGCTALFYSRSAQMVKTLIENGADPSYRDTEGHLYLKRVYCGDSLLSEADVMKVANILSACGPKLNNWELLSAAAEVLKHGRFTEMTRHTMKLAALRYKFFPNPIKEVEEEEVDSDDEYGRPKDKYEKNEGLKFGMNSDCNNNVLTVTRKFYDACLQEVQIMENVFFDKYSLCELLIAYQPRHLSLLARKSRVRDCMRQFLADLDAKKINIQIYLEPVKMLIHRALKIESLERVVAKQLHDDKVIQISYGIKIDVLSLLEEEELLLMLERFKIMDKKIEAIRRSNRAVFPGLQELAENINKFYGFDTHPRDGNNNKLTDVGNSNEDSSERNNNRLIHVNDFTKK